MTIIKKEDAIMAEEIKKEVKEEVKKQEEIPAEVVKEEVKADAPKEEAKVVPKKDKPKAETKKATAAKQEKKQEKKQEEVKKELPPIEYKALSSSSKNTAIHSLMLQIKNGKLNLDHPVQRQASQWGLRSQEMLLMSLAQGVIVNAIVIAEKDGERFCLDGKQRLSTLYSFLCKPDDPKFNPKLKVFGRSFAELDDATKDAIDGSNINVITYANCSEKEIFELFERYNNGVALSGSQKSRSYCTIALLSRINELLNSHFISEVCNLTKGSILKSEPETMLVQSAMIVSGFSFKSFAQKEVDRFLNEVEEKDIMAAFDIIEEHIQILDSIVSEKNKNLKKIHLPMIIACCNDTEAFKNKLLNFLEHYDDDSDQEIQNYKQNACQGSTSQKTQVEMRLNYWKP